MSTPSITSSGTKRKRGSEMKFYAVRSGHKPGVYHSWADCKEQITGYKGAVYKSFPSLTDAAAYVRGAEGSPTSSSTPKKFYAVQSGKVPGVYTDWPSAQRQIVGWTKPRHKSFTTRAEAEAFVAEGHAVADPATVFPLESPLPIKAFEGAQAYASDSTPAAKKTKITKPKQATQTMSGPGYDFLSPEAEDGFDARIIMDPQTGQLRYRTEQELNARKLMPKTNHHGETLHIWTDGACMGNGKLRSTGGVGVYFGPNDPRNIAEPLLGRQTNNRAELTALKRALSIAPMNRPVCIHTDSKYAIDCVTNWFINWRKRGWKNAQGKPVENKELIEEILKIIEDRHQCRAMTNFEWVKGHAGQAENEQADRLAVEGALENRRKGISHPGNTNNSNEEEGLPMDDEFADDIHDHFMDAHEDMSMI